MSGRDDIGERRRAAHDQTYVRLPDGSRSRPSELPPDPAPARQGETSRRPGAAAGRGGAPCERARRYQATTTRGPRPNSRSTSRRIPPPPVRAPAGPRPAVADGWMCVVVAEQGMMDRNKARCVLRDRCRAIHKEVVCAHGVIGGIISYFRGRLHLFCPPSKRVL